MPFHTVHNPSSPRLQIAWLNEFNWLLCQLTSIKLKENLKTNNNKKQQTSSSHKNLLAFLLDHFRAS